MCLSFKWVLPTFSTIISLLLLLKLVEMYKHINISWKIPRELIDRLGRAVYSGLQLNDLLEECRDVWDPTKWLFTRYLFRLPKLLRTPGKWIFRWPVLMIAQASLLLWVHKQFIVTSGCVLIIAGVWLELLQRFVFRLRFGYLDTYVRKATTSYLTLESQPPFHASHHLDLVEDFVLLFGRLVLVVIIGYACVYSAIQLTLSPGSFNGELGQGWTSISSMLYFSVVTVATVGYGDIFPKTAVVRLVVASEIMAGFMLLVLLITAFAFTTIPSQDQGRTD
jgi:hypothetical protein